MQASTWKTQIHQNTKPREATGNSRGYEEKHTFQLLAS
jgi:hypothetical protein